MIGTPTRALIVPPKFCPSNDLKVDVDTNCPEDRIYWIDRDGRVHWFEYAGRIERGTDVLLEKNP